MTNHRDTLRDHGGRVLPAVEAAWEGVYVTAVLPKPSRCRRPDIPPFVMLGAYGHLRIGGETP